MEQGLLNGEEARGKTQNKEPERTWGSSSSARSFCTPLSGYLPFLINFLPHLLCPTLTQFKGTVWLIASQVRRTTAVVAAAAGGAAATIQALHWTLTLILEFSPILGEFRCFPILQRRSGGNQSPVAIYHITFFVLMWAKDPSLTLARTCDDSGALLCFNEIPDVVRAQPLQMPSTKRN